jgi:hypothetical protein
MATSGTSAFTLSFTDIAEEAFERAGSELRTGYHLRTARRSMALLTLEWANRGINLWTVEEGALSLVAGTASYLLPADTIDLLEGTLRTNHGVQSSQHDAAIARIGFSIYSTIPNKLQQGRPSQFFVDRKRDAPSVLFWPVPKDNSYRFIYWRMRRIQDPGTAIETPDVPPRFFPALVAGLAYYVGMKLPDPEARSRLNGLQAEYERQFGLAVQEDGQRVPLRITPRIGRIGRP